MLLAPASAISGPDAAHRAGSIRERGSRPHIPAQGYQRKRRLVDQGVALSQGAVLATRSATAVMMHPKCGWQRYPIDLAIRFSLPFGELEASACFSRTVFLTLNNPSIAREKSRCLQGRAV